MHQKIESNKTKGNKNYYSAPNTTPPPPKAKDQKIADNNNFQVCSV